MNKFLSLAAVLALISNFVTGQTVSGKLLFGQGQVWDIRTEVRNTLAQQVNDQSIDFNVNGTAQHTYTITNTTDDNTTLRHTVSRFAFSFDGMGTKRNFDSDSKKDMEGSFGKPVREMLSKNYDLIVDGNGKTLLCKPEKVAPATGNDQLAFISGMLPDLTSIFYPPAKGSGSFFKVLPEKEIAIGEVWSDTINTDMEKSTTDYTLTAITDTGIIVDFKSNAMLVIKSEMRGMEVTSNLKSTSSGQIILDKSSRLVRRKKSQVNATGTAEIMGTTTPVTSKTWIDIEVAPGTTRKK